MSDIAAGLEAVRDRVRMAAEAAGRDPDGIALLAVSKGQPLEAVRAAIAAGQSDFGENYLQDAGPKLDALDADETLSWHYIGLIQSNKTRRIAARFDWVHTVDRSRIVERLAAQRPPLAPPLNVCLQLRSDDDPRAAGAQRSELPALAAAVAAAPSLRLRGLMTVPPPDPDPEAARPHFRALREAGAELEALGLAIDTYSMGMTADLEVAVSEGATLLRVGTAIFGPRSQQPDR